MTEMDDSPLNGLYSKYKPFESDLAHIMTNLLEHYSYPMEEATIVENMDNFIDEKGYTRIEFCSAKDNFTIKMYGSGIPAEVFNTTLHTLAGTTKTKGQGLGHYGWGMKVGLGIADRIQIFTKREQFQGGQEWIVDAKGIPQHAVLQSPNFTEDMTIIEHQLKQDFQGKIDEVFVCSTLQKFYPTVLDGAPCNGRTVEVLVNGKKVEPPEISYTKKVPVHCDFEDNEICGYFLYNDKEYDEKYDKVAVIVFGRVIMREAFGVPTGGKVSGYIHADVLADEVRGDKTVIKRSSKLWNGISTIIGKQLNDFLKSIGELKEEETWDSDFIRSLHQDINETIRHFPDLFGDFKARSERRQTAIMSPTGAFQFGEGMGGQSAVNAGAGGSGGGGGNKTTDSGGTDPNSTGPDFSKKGEISGFIKNYRKKIGVQIRPKPLEQKVEALFDYPVSTVFINTNFPTYRKAEASGKRVLNYHCNRCTYDALLEYVIENKTDEKDVGDRLKEFMFQRTEILSKWGEM